ncbi:DUF927 domain-containing protein [Clostridium baratii]
MSQFTLDDNGVNLNDNGKKIKIAKYIKIIEIQENIDDNTYRALIEYKAFSDIKQILMPRGDYLNKNNLIKYQNKGLDVVNKNVELLIQYLYEEENEAPKKNIHTKIGFSNYKGETIYKLYECIGIDSRYEGKEDVTPIGNKDEYIDMLNKEVIGNTALEFIVAVSLSSVLLGYIGEDLGVDSLILHIVGNSTTGKSTALKLAISLFGNPDVKKSGLFGTYNGTNNALIKKLTGLKGVPFALDEISMSYTKNFTNFIYALANGTDKDRLDKDSELKDRETWLTTILSNGEKSLIGASNKNAGVQIRVIEASNVTWTKDAENAETINRVVSQNYGHLGFDFAKYIMSVGKDELIKGFEKSKDEIYQLLGEKLITDDMTIRRCSKFAIIIQSAYLFQDMMDITLDIDGIKNMIIDIEKESISNRNFRESAIEYIKQYISKYNNKFKCTTNNLKENIGKITQKENYSEVQMNKISFEEMIREGGYEDVKVVLKELKDAGYLDCEKDRYTRSRKNNLGYTENVYVIKLYK